MKGRKELERVVSSLKIKVRLLEKCHTCIYADKVQFKSKLLSVTRDLLSDSALMHATRDGFRENMFISYLNGDML